MPSPIALIAGQGALPRLLIRHFQTTRRPFCVLGFGGETDPETLEGIPHACLSLGQIGQALDYFRSQKVVQIVMAGKINRPSLTNLKVDWKVSVWMALLIRQAPQGEDGLLRFLTDQLEKEGFQVISPQSLLDHLCIAEGPITRLQPSPEALEDIRQGFHILNQLSPLDIGQAIVVQQGCVLGIEAAEGTDLLIQRCQTLQKSGPAATLIKAPKKTQDMRLDPPVIGLQTLKEVARAGFQGVAVASGRTLMLDQEAVIAYADAASLFVIGYAEVEVS